MANIYVWSGATGTGTGADWTNAKTTLALAFAVDVAGDNIFVAHDHSESNGAAVTLTSAGTTVAPVKVMCVNRAGSVPPVSADRRATAQLATITNFAINLTGCTHYDGIIFLAGNSTGTANILLNNAASTWTRFDNCSLRIGSTGTGGRVSIPALGGTLVELNNTTMQFANVSQGVSVGGMLRWRNTPSALLLGTVPTVLFIPGSGGLVECIGVDLSALNTTIVGQVGSSISLAAKIMDCKLHASVTKSAVPLSPGASETDFLRCGPSA